MTEYWKSTPNYWCKFCETFVRDTPLGKQQHEATGRHKGAIERSLRKLHREQQTEERDKQRAKDEIERLKGIVSGKPVARGSSNSASGSRHVTTAPAQKATHEDRMKQLKQLADLGVAVPDEYRKDMAMASEWQTVSVKRVEERAAVKDEPDSAKSFGVRKRKADDEDEQPDGDPNLGASAPPRNWGSRRKTYQDVQETDLDFDELIKTGKQKVEPKAEPEETLVVKNSESDEENDLQAQPPVESGASYTKEDSSQNVGPVVFKKRKAKGSRAN